MTYDLLQLALKATFSHRLRSLLSMLGIAIGIASVILLTSVGEGTRRYVLSQFSQFGTQVMTISPGRAETLGIPGVLGGTTHKLSLDDAAALARLPGVVQVLPSVNGTARVEAASRGRSVAVFGVTPAMTEVWSFHVRQGSFWPATDPRRAPPLAVLGPTASRELFGGASPLGQFVHVGGRRFRVVGVMEPKGQLLGLDLDDAVYIPTGLALRLFNQDELSTIDLLYRHAALLPEVERAVRARLIERHDGNEDFSITTQAGMLEVLGNVMGVITLAVGAIAGISLLVGAVGILTMMWIAVGERTSEIGLVRALGASRHQVRLLFLTEAAALAGAGGVLGLAGGLGLCAVLRAAIPGLPVATPPLLAAAAVVVSLATGLVSGVLPAQRAARLDPIEALRTE